jgi:hypothetical protein
MTAKMTDVNPESQGKSGSPIFVEKILVLPPLRFGQGDIVLSSQKEDGASE